MKRIAIMAVALAMGMGATAQDNIETTISADIVSQYVWRGLDLGNVSLQPTLGISHKGFSLTAWGSVGLTEPADTKEFDLTATYTTGGLNIGVTDYWFNAGPDPKNRYFKYDAHGTNHVFEANIGYDFGPVSLQWDTNFAGADGINKDGDRRCRAIRHGLLWGQRLFRDQHCSAGNEKHCHYRQVCTAGLCQYCHQSASTESLFRLRIQPAAIEASANCVADFLHIAAIGANHDFKVARFEHQTAIGIVE